MVGGSAWWPDCAAHVLTEVRNDAASMGVRDFAGIFSRFFVVGFFLPAFFTGAALDQMSGGSLFPAAYRSSAGTRLLIIGGIAVLLGLTLSALHQTVLSLFAGGSLLPRFVRRTLTYRWLHKMDRMQWGLREAMMLSREELTRWQAAGAMERLVRLDKQRAQFWVPPELVQPTRFGNALVAGGRRVWTVGA
jgi:hypothetical protein